MNHSRSLSSFTDDDLILHRGGSCWVSLSELVLSRFLSLLLGISLVLSLFFTSTTKVNASITEYSPTNWDSGHCSSDLNVYQYDDSSVSLISSNQYCRVNYHNFDLAEDFTAIRFCLKTGDYIGGVNSRITAFEGDNYSYTAFSGDSTYCTIWANETDLTVSNFINYESLYGPYLRPMISNGSSTAINIDKIWMEVDAPDPEPSPIPSPTPSPPPEPVASQSGWLDFDTPVRFGSPQSASYSAILDFPYPTIGTHLSPNPYTSSGSLSAGAAASNLDGEYLYKTACVDKYTNLITEAEYYCSSFEPRTLYYSYHFPDVPDIPDNYLIDGIEFRVKGDFDGDNTIISGWKVFNTVGANLSKANDLLKLEDDGFYYYYWNNSGLNYERIIPTPPTSSSFTVSDFENSFSAFNFYTDYDPENIVPVKIDTVQYKLYFSGVGDVSVNTNVTQESQTHDAGMTTVNLSGSFSQNLVTDEDFCRLDFYDTASTQTAWTPDYKATLYMNNAVWLDNQWTVINNIVPDLLNFSLLPPHVGQYFFANGNTRDWTASLTIQNPLGNNISLDYTMKCYYAEQDPFNAVPSYTHGYETPQVFTGAPSSIIGADPISYNCERPSGILNVGYVDYAFCLLGDTLNSALSGFYSVNQNTVNYGLSSVYSNIQQFPPFSYIFASANALNEGFAE